MVGRGLGAVHCVITGGVARCMCHCQPLLHVSAVHSVTATQLRCARPGIVAMVVYQDLEFAWVELRSVVSSWCKRRPRKMVLRVWYN